MDTIFYEQTLLTQGAWNEWKSKATLQAADESAIRLPQWDGKTSTDIL